VIRRSSAADWTTVDRSADPGTFVKYLDAVTSHDAVQAYKQKSFALLGLRPGDHVLDVGCGAGDDARALARIVGPGGQVVGVDASVAMVEEARRRSDGHGLPLEFHVGDAHGLAFAEGEFDGVRADRVFQHLDDPERALAELIRVTRRGGRIVVADSDWGTLALDGSDRETTRAVLDEIAAAIRNPWMGRQLFGLFHRAGLAEVVVESGTAVTTDYVQADKLFKLGEGMRRAQASGAMTEEAAAHWTRALEEAAEGGRFCCAITGFIVSARRL
jgi:ubiquinone/menaquinone biosynthesis C-methylase UbiE